MKVEKKLPSIKDGNQTDSVTVNATDCSTLLTLTLTLTLTYDLDFQSSTSYNHDPYTRKKSRSKVSWFKGRVETNGRTRPIAVPSR